VDNSWTRVDGADVVAEAGGRPKNRLRLLEAPSQAPVTVRRENDDRAWQGSAPKRSERGPACFVWSRFRCESKRAAPPWRPGCSRAVDSAGGKKRERPAGRPTVVILACTINDEEHGITGPRRALGQGRQHISGTKGPAWTGDGAFTRGGSSRPRRGRSELLTATRGHAGLMRTIVAEKRPTKAESAGRGHKGAGPLLALIDRARHTSETHSSQARNPFPAFGAITAFYHPWAAGPLEVGAITGRDRGAQWLARRLAPVLRHSDAEVYGGVYADSGGTISVKHSDDRLQRSRSEPAA